MNEALLAKIIGLSSELSQAQDVDQLLNMTIEQAAEVVGAEKCHVILVKEGGGLDFRVGAGCTVPPDGHEDEISRSIFDQVTATGKPLVLTDALNDERFGSVSVIELRIRSIMCVPLIARGNVLGALYVENRSIAGAFFEEDLELLMLFANQAAVTIENAFTIATLEQRVEARTAQVQMGWLEAVEANRLRTIFLGQLSHDLRSPAQIIRGTLDLAALDETPGACAKTLTRASHALDQMIALIDDVLDMTRAEVRELRLAKRSVDTGAFLDRMYGLGSGLPRSTDVDFRLELRTSLPELEIDPVRIQQVILNLLGNAMKYTQEGEVVLYAEHVTDNEVHVGVSDTGVGIPPCDAERVFSRFFRGDDEVVQGPRGSGLGLAISRELVGEHGGRLWLAANAVGRGSDFRLALHVNAPQPSTTVT